MVDIFDIGTEELLEQEPSVPLHDDPCTTTSRGVKRCRALLPLPFNHVTPLLN